MNHEKNRSRPLRKQQMAEQAAARPEQAPYPRDRTGKAPVSDRVVTVAEVKAWLEKAGYRLYTAHQRRKAVNAIRTLAYYHLHISGN